MAPPRSQAAEAKRKRRKVLREQRERAEREQDDWIDSLSCSQKVAWARQHIDTLDKSIKGWFDRGGYTLVHEIDPETGYHVLRTKIAEPPQDDWPLLIGDIAHNLRAALDHVAFVLMGAHQSHTNPGVPIPATVVRESEFPVISGVNEKTGKTGIGEQQFKSAAGTKLPGISRDARAAVKALQPYHRGAQFAADELWLIHDLDRVDKHRELAVVTASVYLPEVSIGGSGFLPHLWIGGGVVEDGTKVAEWAQPEGPAPRVNLKFAGEIAFGQGTAAQGRKVGETLRGLADYLSGTVIPRLARLL